MPPRPASSVNSADQRVTRGSSSAFSASGSVAGAAATGATARAQAEGLFKNWINAFNQRLAANFSGESRVKVVDVATRFTDQMTNPSKYGLTNATLPYALQIANKGWKQACLDNPGLKNGLNMVGDTITFKGVADAFGLPYPPADSCL